MVKVVSCIIINENCEILILKRSDKVRTYKKCWSGVAGYIEEGERPIDTAFKEIKEEISLDKNDVELVKKGDIFEVPRVNNLECSSSRVCKQPMPEMLPIFSGGAISGRKAL